ncbi:MAG: HD domain-containing protein [Tissierellia bacterium]|nr:HD domain-containing protein [Tissierellia bacterium]
MQYRFNLDDQSKLIIKRLNDNSYKAYAVGGFVRDSILGLTNSDIDIATDARPQELRDLFRDFDILDIGARFGTLVIIIDGSSYEVTSFRSEGTYSDGRRPDSVVFSKDLREDLSRRDFTINAMAYHPEEGLIDYFKGEDDLKKGLIRTVGDPFARFEEDHLRMLRAVRFASKLDMQLEDNLFLAIKEGSDKIAKVSYERIRQEVEKIIMSDHALKGFSLLYKTGLLAHIIEDLHKAKGFSQDTIHHKYDLFDHTMSVLSFLPKDLELRLAAIFHDLGKLYTKFIGKDGQAHFYGHDKLSASMAEDYLRRLRFDKKTIDNVCHLVSRHMEAMNIYTEKSIKRLIRKIGQENCRKLFYLQKADILSTNNPQFVDNIENAFEILDKILKEDEVIFRKQVAINGYDIIDLGYKEGKIIGQILNFITDLVADKKIANDKETIKKYIADRSYSDGKNNNIRFRFRA